MYLNSLNYYPEAKARQQTLLRKAEHEHAISKLLRSLRQASKRVGMSKPSR